MEAPIMDQAASESQSSLVIVCDVTPCRFFALQLLTGHRLFDGAPASKTKDSKADALNLPTAKDAGSKDSPSATSGTELKSKESSTEHLIAVSKKSFPLPASCEHLSRHLFGLRFDSSDDAIKARQMLNEGGFQNVWLEGWTLIWLDSSTIGGFLSITEIQKLLQQHKQFLGFFLVRKLSEIDVGKKNGSVSNFLIAVHPQDPDKAQQILNLVFEATSDFTIVEVRQNQSFVNFLPKGMDKIYSSVATDDKNRPMTLEEMERLFTSTVISHSFVPLTPLEKHANHFSPKCHNTSGSEIGSNLYHKGDLSKSGMHYSISDYEYATTPDGQRLHVQQQSNHTYQQSRINKDFNLGSVYTNYSLYSPQGRANQKSHYGRNVYSPNATDRSYIGGDCNSECEIGTAGVGQNFNFLMENSNGLGHDNRLWMPRSVSVEDLADKKQPKEKEKRRKSAAGFPSVAEVAIVVAEALKAAKTRRSTKREFDVKAPEFWPSTGPNSHFSKRTTEGIGVLKCLVKCRIASIVAKAQEKEGEYLTISDVLSVYAQQYCAGDTNTDMERSRLAESAITSLFGYSTFKKFVQTELSDMIELFTIPSSPCNDEQKNSVKPLLEEEENAAASDADKETEKMATENKSVDLHKELHEKGEITYAKCLQPDAATMDVFFRSVVITLILDEMRRKRIKNEARRETDKNETCVHDKAKSYEACDRCKGKCLSISHIENSWNMRLEHSVPFEDVAKCCGVSNMTEFVRSMPSHFRLFEEDTSLAKIDNEVASKVENEAGGETPGAAAESKVVPNTTVFVTLEDPNGCPSSYESEQLKLLTDIFSGSHAPSEMPTSPNSERPLTDTTNQRQQLTSLSNLSNRRPPFPIFAPSSKPGKPLPHVPPNIYCRNISAPLRPPPPPYFANPVFSPSPYYPRLSYSTQPNTPFDSFSYPPNNYTLSPPDFATYRSAQQYPMPPQNLDAPYPSFNHLYSSFPREALLSASSATPPPPPPPPPAALTLPNANFYPIPQPHLLQPIPASYNSRTPYPASLALYNTLPNAYPFWPPNPSNAPIAYPSAFYKNSSLSQITSADHFGQNHHQQPPQQPPQQQLQQLLSLLNPPKTSPRGHLQTTLVSSPRPLPNDNALHQTFSSTSASPQPSTSVPPLTLNSLLNSFKQVNNTPPNAPSTPHLFQFNNTPRKPQHPILNAIKPTNNVQIGNHHLTTQNPKTHSHPISNHCGIVDEVTRRCDGFSDRTGGIHTAGTGVVDSFQSSAGDNRFSDNNVIDALLAIGLSKHNRTGASQIIQHIGGRRETMSTTVPTAMTTCEGTGDGVEFGHPMEFHQKYNWGGNSTHTNRNTIDGGNLGEENTCYQRIVSSNFAAPMVPMAGTNLTSLIKNTLSNMRQ